MEEDDSLPQDTAADHGPGEWRDTPEEYRAMDLGCFIIALRKLSHRTPDDTIGDLIAADRSLVHNLVLGADHLHEDLLAWAEAELAKLNEARHD